VKRATLALAFIVPIALLTSACASLGSYFSPQIQSDEAAVIADTEAVNNDLLQAKIDYSTNKALLPGDAARLIADQTTLATAVVKWTSDLKAVGSPAPTVPAATAAALAAPAPATN